MGVPSAEVGFRRGQMSLGRRAAGLTRPPPEASGASGLTEAAQFCAERLRSGVGVGVDLPTILTAAPPASRITVPEDVGLDARHAHGAHRRGAGAEPRGGDPGRGARARGPLHKGRGPGCAARLPQPRGDLALCAQGGWVEHPFLAERGRAQPDLASCCPRFRPKSTDIANIWATITRIRPRNT